MAFEENSYDRLAELNGSKYEIINGEPNIVGWKVRTEDGLKVGRVDDLLFNPESQKVKYMIVNFSGNELHLETDRQVLIPINVADLYSEKNYEKSVISTSTTEYISRNNAYNPAKDGDVVVLPGITIAQLNSLPLYEKNHLSPDIERAIRKILERPATAPHKESPRHHDEHRESSENTRRPREEHKR